MDLGEKADFIAIEDQFLVEQLDNGWWNAYCTRPECGGHAAGIDRETVDIWMDAHMEVIHKTNAPD